MFQNIFFQYIVWQFWESPKAVLKGWGNFIKFGENYFSIWLLLSTLFSPWRRNRWFYPKSFSFGAYAGVFFSNLVSRILGLILRTFLIIIGLLFEIFIILAGIIVFLGWLALPALLILGLIFGIKILLK